MGRGRLALGTCLRRFTEHHHKHQKQGLTDGRKTHLGCRAGLRLDLLALDDAHVRRQQVWGRGRVVYLQLLVQVEVDDARGACLWVRFSVDQI